MHVQIDLCQLLPAAGHGLLRVRVAEGPLLQLLKTNLAAAAAGQQTTSQTNSHTIGPPELQLKALDGAQCTPYRALGMFLNPASKLP